MFDFIFQAAQQAKQISPDIYVTVQQPAGLPEWVKILLSAAVGAMFGLAGSLSTEYVKPWIARLHTRKNMIPQLNDEFLNGFERVKDARRLLETPRENENGERLMAGLMLATITRDRFDYYFSEQKELVYEYDKNLVAFYNLISMVRTFVDHNRDKEIPELVRTASQLAQSYIAAHGLTDVPKGVLPLG